MTRSKKTPDTPFSGKVPRDCTEAGFSPKIINMRVNEKIANNSFFGESRRSSFISGLVKVGRTYREALMAFIFNLVGIAAGTTVALQLGLFRIVPWAIAVYPAIISARGVIGGLLSGRLSTALHVGTMQPKFFRNTRTFYSLLRAVVMLTLEMSILMSIVASLFGSFLWGATLLDFASIFAVIVATMTLALVVVSPLTITVSSLSFRHGLDPDVVLYPIESTVSDLFITLCYSITLNLFFSSGFEGKAAVILLGISLLVLTAYILPKGVHEPEFVETIKESILTIILVAFIVNVTGSVLGRISEVVQDRREVYTAYPALIDTVGDVGAVVGSTATTKLALGTLRASFGAISSHATEIAGAWGASLTMFAVYSVLSLLIQGMFTSTSFLRFTALLFAANLMAASTIIAISFVVALLTFKRGLDPDNFVIPIESSLADSITTISLLIALAIIG
jgi:mgtE-like transporter